ncbi:YfdX family protein [Sulfurospirillum sp. 1307]
MKKLVISLVTATLLCGTSIMAQTSNEVENNAVKIAKAEAKDANVKIVKEALNSVKLTKKVLVDLEHGKKKEAIKDLESAIGKLEVILAKKDSPKFLPIDASVNAFEYVGDKKSIEQSVDIVKDLLSDGKVQEARKILDSLQSEIDVISINLPLGSYPDALKLAAKYLHDDNVKGAKNVLYTALNTMVQDVIVLPLPLLKAESLIDAASKISKKDKNQALKHLEAAKKELEVAEALGYLSDSDVTYKILNDKIEDTEKEIKGKNKAEKLFEDLKEKFKSFKKS